MSGPDTRRGTGSPAASQIVEARSRAWVTMASLTVSGLSHPWPADDQGHMHHVLVHHIVLVDHPVPAAGVAMVRGVDHQCRIR